MNKAELIDVLAARLGDKKSASTALDAVLAEIQAAVTKGDKVSITGFGVFEKRVRAARTARNPRTGETVKVKKTSVPAFRAGQGFKDQVASGKVPKVAAKKAVKKAAAPTKVTPTKAATAAKAAAKVPAKTAAKVVAKKAPAKKTTAKATPAASVPVRRTTTAKAAAPAKAPARKAPARKAR